MFFFKQKTAYEMRISDWSSDVCSSDLRDQHLLGAALQVFAGGLLGGEDAGALQHHVDAQLAPRQLRRVALGQHLHLLAVDLDVVLAGLDLARVGPVHGIILQAVRVRLGGAKVVDGDALDRKSVVLGKSVSVRVDLGGGRILIKKKNRNRK